MLYFLLLSDLTPRRVGWQRGQTAARLGQVVAVRVAARLARCRGRVDETLHGAVLEGALGNLAKAVGAAARDLGGARDAGGGAVEAKEVILGAGDGAAGEGGSVGLGRVIRGALAGSGSGGGGGSSRLVVDGDHSRGDFAGGCRSLLVAPRRVGWQRGQTAAGLGQVVAVRVAARLARCRGRVDETLHGAVLEGALGNLAKAV